MASIHSRGVVIDDSVPVTNTLFDHRDKPGLSYRVAYYNHTGRPLTIVDRRGVACRLPSTPGNRQGLNRSLYVAITYDDIDCGTNVILDRPDISDSDPNRAAFIKAFQSKSPTLMSYQAVSKSTTVIYEISAQHVHQSQAVYYRNLDIVVTFMDRTVHHPYEHHGALHNELMTTPGLETADELVFGIRLVDNNGRIGPRYVNINGRVYQIPVSRRADLSDGVYLKNNNRALAEVGLPPPATVNHYAIDDYDAACKEDITLLRLFTTIDLARNLGDMQTARKEELERLVHSRKLLEEDFRQRKLEDDRENDKLKQTIEKQNQEWAEETRRWERRHEELDQQRKDLEHQIKMNEMEAKRRLADVQHEANMQKMNREENTRNSDNIASTLKSVAAIIGGIGVILVAYDKLVKKD